MSKFDSTITLAKIQDGGDSASYEIGCNVEQVYKKSEDGKEIFSPSDLHFALYQKGKKLSMTDGYSVILKSASNQSLPVSGEKFLQIQDKDLVFKLQNFYENILENFKPESGEEQTASIDNQEEYKNYYDILNSNNFLIQCILTQNSEFIAERFLQVTYELDSQVASFSVTAEAIQAAVGAAALEFSNKGLVISNGGLTINDSKGKALEFKEGRLVITGEIHATDGEFKGELISPTGKIGGLILEENSLHSEDEGLKIWLDDQNKSFLKADNLIIGNSGQIEGTLNIGAAKMQNPATNKGIFMVAGGISLSQNGEILLSGASTIKDTNGRWSINGDGSAEFNGVRANNVTLQNSVLEIGTVQSVGSLMLFKDSWEIEKIEKIEPFGEQEEQFKVFLKVNQQAGHTLKKGDYFYCNKKLFEVSEVGEKNTFYVNASIGQELGIGNIITKFGSFDQNSNDYIISIYGESPEGNPFDFAEGSSLTISQGRVEDGEKVFDKRLILGDLSSKGDNLGVGLYADNVILNGSLVTKTDAQSGLNYAGINTKDGVQATIFSEKGIFNNDSSNIIFWAGSESEDAANIKKAPFQVTQNGSIYAQNIYLNNAVMAGGEISGSTIRGNEIYGAKIYGAEIHGNNKDEALKIYDDSNGIEFLGQNGSEAFKIFSINSIGLSFLNNLQLTDEGLGIYQISGEEKLPKSLIRFKQNEIETLIDNLSVAKQTKEKYTVQIPFYLTDTFSLGEKLSYKKVLLDNDEQGYDLYIS